MALPYVLLLHGYTGSGPGHWQNWLAGQLAGRGGRVDIPTLPDPDRPALDAWLAELREHLAVAPGGVERVVLAHSWGATLWLHHAARERTAEHRVDRVLLVSPPGPDWVQAEVVGFQPTPLDPAGLRVAGADTRLVVGDDDPACPLELLRQVAGVLDVELDVVGRGGHLDSAAGYGPWPDVLRWTLRRRVPVRGRGSAAARR